jgi:hypothetical protein
MSAKIVKNAKLIVFPGYPHAMPATNADLLAFFRSSKQAAA